MKKVRGEGADVEEQRWEDVGEGVVGIDEARAAWNWWCREEMEMAMGLCWEMKEGRKVRVLEMAEKRGERRWVIIGDGE